MNQTDLLIALQSDVDCFSGATIDTQLESLPRWDSLSILLVISHIEANYKIILSGQQIRECRTVRDLLNLIPTS